MVTLGDLWLPTLLGGVVVFFASFLMRMVLKHHWTDFSPLPDEDGTMDALRSNNVKRGQYSFPFCKDAEVMKSEEWQAKWAKGPSGFLFVYPEGPVNFGKALGQSLVFNIGVAFVAAYLATMALAPGAEGMLVLRFTGTIGFVGFGAALIWGPIWQQTSWSMCMKELFDALVYGLAMGAVFMALWPALPGS